MNFHLNELTKWKKRGIAFSSDTFFTLFAWIGSSWLSGVSIFEKTFIIAICVMTFIQCSVYVLCGLYRGVWRFASLPDLMRILRATIAGTILSFLYSIFHHNDISLKLYIIYLLLLITLISGSRLLFRWLRDYRPTLAHGKRVLVVGSGSAGEGLIRDLYRSSLIYQYIPVAFVDDNPNRHGCEVQGIRVIGSCENIPNIVRKYNIELILIAIPSASSTRMREIVQYCENSNIPFRTLPSLKDIADGSVTIGSLREVLLEDLLGREQVHHDWESIKKSIIHRTILVTGAGGSIGSELCRQIASLSPMHLIIVDNNEYNLYSIDMELKKLAPLVSIHTYLCSVTDQLEIEKIFIKHHPNIVFHVAAYKHVPLLETHIRIAMYNNIIGTRTLAEVAASSGVNTFVLISTDKAVNPMSIMGATKRAAEIFCQALNVRSNTRYLTVRFGNVLDSAGSVIPLFRQQILHGGPLTVTHPDISRYFMTIPEAAQLILQAATMQDEGEIFVLDMGDPINIRYLAEQMIKLSGKIIGKDIKIKYTGLRPGEKLFEELFHEKENICKTSHPKIKQAKVRYYDWDELIAIFDNILTACNNLDERRLIELLCELVPEYHPQFTQDQQHKQHKYLSEKRTLVYN